MSFKIFERKFSNDLIPFKQYNNNNILDLTNNKEIAPILPFSRIEGIKETIKWLEKYLYEHVH